MIHIVASVVLVLAAFTLTAQAESVMRPQFDEVNLDSNEKYLKHTLTLDDKAPGLNFTLDVLEDFKDARFSIAVGTRDANDADIGMGGKISMNLCDVLAQVKENAELKKKMKNLKEFGEIFESCPIKKGNYYINNFWYTETAAKPNAVAQNFEITLELFATIDGQEHRVLNDNIRGKTVVVEGDLYTGGVLR